MQLRKLLPLIFILAGFYAGFTSAQNSISGAVAQYKLNGNALETSSDSLEGKATGIQPETDRAGNKGGATLFAGTKKSAYGYIRFPVDLSPAGLPVATVCFWIKAGETYQKMVPLFTGEEKSRGILTDYENGAQRWSASAGKDGLIGGPAVLKDQWAFIAVIYDSPNEQARLIVNNEVFGGRARMRKGTAGITLGNFNGTMDDLLIFDRALSLREIESISGIPVTVNVDGFAIEDRSGYRKRMEDERKSRVKPGDRYIVGYDELIIRDSINSPNTQFVFKGGDTVNVISALRNEWFVVRNQQNQQGMIRGSTLESNCYKIGKNKITFRFFNWLSQLFQFNKFRNWLFVAFFTVILIMAIRFRFELNNWFQRLGQRDPREAGGSKNEKVHSSLNFPKFEKYFPVEKPKWWIISPGVIFGLLLVVASIWDGHEMEWYFNEGASVIPQGFTLPIHWVLWTVSILVILLILALVFESLAIAGPWAGLVRIAMLAILNLLAVIVAFYLSAGLLIAIIGFILFFFAAISLIGRRRY
ncbi:MAG: LamG domain-containing protein [Bacteroidales bacterium]|nr:LamG domain-containing protein [Bacteroidales bacterium]